MTSRCNIIDLLLELQRKATKAKHKRTKKKAHTTLEKRNNQMHNAVGDEIVVVVGKEVARAGHGAMFKAISFTTC